jgi:hypothetical protein
MKKLLLLLAIVGFSFKGFSCTCLPERELWGFCQVLDHAKNQPMFCVVQGKILSFYHWGMYVEVLDNIYNAASKDTVLVWGDCGACCRPGFGFEGFVVGDTLVMALEQTDLCGNFIMPQQPDYENPEDYVLQGCGAYFMRFRNGNVIGSFDQNVTGPDTIAYTQFKTEVLNCIPTTGVAVLPGKGVAIYPNPTSAWTHVDAGTVISELKLLNSIGQVVYERSPNRADIDINLTALVPGVYTLVLYHSGRQELSRHTLVRE